MLVKFEQNQTTQNFELFDKKEKNKTFSVAEIIV